MPQFLDGQHYVVTVIGLPPDVRPKGAILACLHHADLRSMRFESTPGSPRSEIAFFFPVSDRYGASETILFELETEPPITPAVVSFKVAKMSDRTGRITVPL